MKTKQIVLAFCCVMITGTSTSALAANSSTQADEPDATTQNGRGAAMMQGQGGMMGGGMLSQQWATRTANDNQGHAGRAMVGCGATGLSAMSDSMMGRAMMGNGMMGNGMMGGGMMGHHAMSDRMLMPRLPAGNEKLQLQMQAEIMQKVGEIIGKYADEIVIRKSEVQ